MATGGEVAASVGTTVLGTGPVTGGKRRESTKAAKRAIACHTRKVKKAYQKYIKLANKKM